MEGNREWTPIDANVSSTSRELVGRRPSSTSSIRLSGRPDKQRCTRQRTAFRQCRAFHAPLGVRSTPDALWDERGREKVRSRRRVTLHASDSVGNRAGWLGRPRAPGSPADRPRRSVSRDLTVCGTSNRPVDGPRFAGCPGRTPPGFNTTGVRHVSSNANRLASCGSLWRRGILAGC